MEMMRTGVSKDLVKLRTHLRQFSLHENAFGPHHEALGTLINGWFKAYQKLVGAA